MYPLHLERQTNRQTMDVTNKFKTNSLNVENVLDFTLMVSILKISTQAEIVESSGRKISCCFCAKYLHIFIDIKLG